MDFELTDEVVGADLDGAAEQVDLVGGGAGEGAGTGAVGSGASGEVIDSAVMLAIVS